MSGRLIRVIGKYTKAEPDTHKKFWMPGATQAHECSISMLDPILCNFLWLN